MSDDFLLVGGIIAVVGLVFFYRAWTSYQQSRHVSQVTADEGTSGESVEGPVEVSEAAEPERLPPDGTDTGSGRDPALWLWRVRRERKSTGSSRGRSTTWETVESGVAAGRFAVRQQWDRIEVDANSVAGHTSEETGTTMSDRHRADESFQNSDDPFESTQFYVGEPEIDVLVGEPSLPQRLVDKYLPFDLDVTFSFGRKTTTPDRYQASVIRDSDELLVSGSLDKSVEPPTLTSTDTTPLVFVKGDADERATKYRRSSLKRLTFGIGFVLVGVGIALAGVL